MKKIGENGGAIYFNDTNWAALNSQIIELQPSTVFILTDNNTKAYCLPILLDKISFPKTPEILTIPSGEDQKNIKSCLYLWKKLSKKQGDRKSLLINLGGGVITDLGGFIASTFKRGISFINIPTSLLAMVDAAIGGKNGIDLDSIKNQIGVINQPHSIIINTIFLKTLPKSEVTSGYAEMLKHGLIDSSDYWSRVKDCDFGDDANTSALIWESIEIKNKVVSLDPNEQGLRKTLNYGHTLGHAIESYFLNSNGKKSLLHGEAIAVGMILATYISSKLLDFPKDLLQNITTVILSSFPKISFVNEDIDAIIKLLIYDKKNDNGKIQFVLLADIGIYKINCEVPNTIILEAFDFYKKF